VTLEEKIILSFEYFIAEISCRKDYMYAPYKWENKSIENFATLLKNKYGSNSIGVHWFFNYFCFQFEYWRTKKTELGEGLAYIEWIIGPKAFKRWEGKTKDYWYFCQEGLLNFNKEIKFSKFKIIIEGKSIFDINKIRTDEEIEKGLYINQRKGFYNCLLYTTLFNKKSGLCQNCKFQENCKKIQRSNYPGIYKIRNNELQN